MTDREFYMTYARSRPDSIVPWVEEHNVGLMTNAAHRWSRNTDRFLHMWEYDTPRIVDSGGYNIQSQWVKDQTDVRGPLTQDDVRSAVKNAADLHDRELASDSPFFPWTVEQYHDWLQDHADQFNWVACMDYACEELFEPLWTKEQRMEATIENTIRHFDLEPDYDLLPVLQGRTLEDYLWSHDRLEEVGIPTNRVGLGTVCRLSSSNDIVDLEQRLRQERDFDYIHGFGVKINAYKLGASFESADSQAWSRPPSNMLKLTKENGRLKREKMVGAEHSKERTVESFKAYYRHVMELMTGEDPIPDPLTVENTDQVGFDQFISEADGQ